RTHQWIIDRVLDPDVGILGAAADLRHDGALTRTLRALVPADDARDWAHFIAVLVANLRHALLLPVARRNEAWVRWLFLIPYSVQWEALGAPRPPGGRRAWGAGQAAAGAGAGRLRDRGHRRRDRAGVRHPPRRPAVDGAGRSHRRRPSGIDPR